MNENHQVHILNFFTRNLETTGKRMRDESWEKKRSGKTPRVERMFIP